MQSPGSPDERQERNDLQIDLERRGLLPGQTTIQRQSLSDPELERQLGFSVHELNSTERAVGRALRSAEDIESATEAAIGYFRPAGYTRSNPRNGHGFNTRLANAQAVLAGTAGDRPAEAFAFYQANGLTDVQAAAMVGNLMQESFADLQTGAVGDSGTATGIAQWRDSRQQALNAFQLPSSGATTMIPGATRGRGSTGAFSPVPRDPQAGTLQGYAREVQTINGIPQENGVVVQNQKIWKRQRNLDLAPELNTLLTDVAQTTGVSFVVFSGGQSPDNRPKGASVRHDHGNAADVYLVKDGRVLDYDNEQDFPIIKLALQQAVARGATGIGAGKGYMNNPEGKGIHIGFGTKMAWGAKGRAKNAPAWLNDIVYGPTMALLEKPAPQRTEAIAKMDEAELLDTVPDMATFYALPVDNQLDVLEKLFPAPEQPEPQKQAFMTSPMSPDGVRRMQPKTYDYRPWNRMLEEDNWMKEQERKYWNDKYNRGRHGPEFLDPPPSKGFA